MADTIAIYLSGGPCDGEFKHITPDQFATKAYSCGGTVYVAAGGSASLGGYLYITAAEAQAQSSATGALHPQDAAAAWHRFTHTLAVGAPRQIRRQHAAIARLRRLAR